MPKTTIEEAAEKIGGTGKTSIPIKKLEIAIKKIVEENERNKNQKLKELKNKKVSLYEFTSIIDRLFTIIYYPRLQRFGCAFDDGFIKSKETKTLTNIIGESDTIEQALKNYVKLINGRVIVFNPNDKNERKYQVPKKLYV